MLHNNDFICIIILPAEKIRFPNAFSLFSPDDFKIVYYDAFISFLICHCTFNMWKVILSLELSFLIHQATSLTFVANDFLYSRVYVPVIYVYWHCKEKCEFDRILQVLAHSVTSVEIVFYIYHTYVHCMSRYTCTF